MDAFCGSTFWNSSVTWYTKSPDFTICFEKTILIWLPCIYLWIFSIFEAHRITKSQNKHIPWNWRNVSKVLVVSILFILTVCDSFYNGFTRENIYGVDIATPIIKLISFALVLTLILANRKRGLRTSGVQFFFWLLLVLCGLFQLRTEIKMLKNKLLHAYYTYLFYSIYYSLVLLIFLLSCINDLQPKGIVIYSKNISPEEDCCFISHLFFSWFETLAWKGFRNPLKDSDLYDLGPENSAKEVVLHFDEYVYKSVAKQKKSKVGQKKEKIALLPIILKALAPGFAFCISIKLICDLLSFAVPQILSLLINFVNEKEEYWKGYFYATLLFVTGTVRSLFLAQYSHRTNIMGLHIKTALNSFIYKKALKISSRARKNYTVGEIVNLISTDVKCVSDLPTNLTVILSAFMQVLIALYFLWNILGISVLAGLTVMLILIPVNSFITNKLKKLHFHRMEKVDYRIKLINEVLSSIKVLKLYAWEPYFQHNITDTRHNEIRLLKKTAYISSGTSFIWSCAPFLVSLVCFATFVLIDEANVLDAKVAFVSIALFNILRNPLNLLPNMITNMVQALVSIQRINRLLNSEELNFESISHDYLQSAQLIIRDGTFSWGDEPVLRNINFSCEKSSLSAIVGSVGSGKSSLISSFLGETYKVSGYVNVFGTIAYVPQQAWIQNASLRDNILFGKPYDRMKYQRIIRACALKSDFEMLPAGDSTEIGEKGINLSGGQKQRISLARAVYSNADVYMFDDPLSAVDTHVGKHIFEKVLGPNGLLKSKTRILVTHAITYLPYVNNIIVMKNGEISERGSYQELLDKKGDFSEFLINHTSDDSNEFSTVTLQRTISEFQDSLQHSSITSHDKFQMSQFSLKNMKLIEIEKAETGSVDWNVYKFYLKSVGIFLTMATIILNMFSHGLSIGSNFWLTVWSTDTSIVVNGTTNHSKTTFYLGVYSALGLAKAITSIFAVLAPQLGGCYAAIKLHKLLLHRICHAPMSFFDVTPLGRILSRFSKDISVLDNKLPNFLFQGVNLVFAVIATLCVISYTAPIFIVLIIPVGILYYLIQKFYVATSRQLKRLQAISRSPIYSYFGESITGAQSIRAFKSQARFLNEFERRMDVNQACYYLSTVANRWLAIRLEMLGNVVILFAVLFAVTVKHLNAGLLGLSVTYALEITQTLNTLVRITSEIETNIVSVERIKEYGEAPQEASWENTIAQPECTWPDKGVVEFKNYGVRYRPGLDLVLKCANFKINENEKIGIVGRTGAGKSSLTLSLFRILEAAKGEILIDDVNIAYLGLHSLRSRITIIPQDAVLFHGTVRKNLDPFSKHTDQEIWRALEHAYLKAFVEGLPLGLYHTVTEGGENFSVGQRQLICLGRALLRKTKVLILDEATAAIDLDTDDLIQKSIRTEFNNCTVLTIAHRLNTIMDSDRVIVLDKGNIVEFDTPQNLLKLEGIFYSMCRNAGLA